MSICADWALLVSETRIGSACALISSSRRSVFGYCGTDTSVICPPDTVIATCTAP